MAENSHQMNSRNYAESWIKRELTTPYNPQHNGVVERKNITIMEAARVMHHDQDLPMHLWEVLSHVFVFHLLVLLFMF